MSSYLYLTYLYISSYIVFILIKYLRVFITFDFIIELIGFNSLLIHLPSIISYYYISNKSILY